MKNIYSNLIDCHTHTTNSPDGYNSVDEMCARAFVELGIPTLAITDHCEVNRYYGIEHYGGIKINDEDTFNFDAAFEKSMNSNSLAKEKWADKLNLICGIELGQASHDFEAARKDCVR